MEKTSAELFFSWFEDVWTHGVTTSPGALLDRSRAGGDAGDAASRTLDGVSRARRSQEELTDIRLDFESFESNGDQVTCAFVVKARGKASNEPVTFRAKFDGRVRDGQLVSAANAIDYLAAK